MCVYVQLCAGTLGVQRLQSRGAEVRDSCEPPNVGDGTEFWSCRRADFILNC